MWLPADREFAEKALAKSVEAERLMEEAEKLTKQKRKDRLQLFHACLLDYLNTECGSNYKIKWPKSESESKSINKIHLIDKSDKA